MAGELRNLRWFNAGFDLWPEDDLDVLRVSSGCSLIGGPECRLPFAHYCYAPLRREFWGDAKPQGPYVKASSQTVSQGGR